MKSILLYLTFFGAVVLTGACGSDNTSDAGNSEPNEQIAQADSSDLKTNTNASEEKSIWGLYAGKLGLYEQEVVFELEITGEKVKGSYFYAKHQKTIQLDGTYDPNTSTAKVVETYKGKATGYLVFQLQKGELSGHWMKKAGATEKEEFHADLLPMDRVDYTPKFEKYEYEHLMRTYNGEDYEEEEVTDVLHVTHIGRNYFVFYYSVIGSTGHMGSLNGLGEKKGGKSYFDDKESCRLTFDFRGNSVEVLEAGDCQNYRGFNAYFNGLLEKVR